MPRPKTQKPVSRKSATKQNVADDQNVSLRTVDAWIHDHKIPYRKLGKRLLRFNLDDVDAALRRYTIDAVK